MLISKKKVNIVKSIIIKTSFFIDINTIWTLNRFKLEGEGGGRGATIHPPRVASFM